MCYTVAYMLKRHFDFKDMVKVLYLGARCSQEGGCGHPSLESP